MVGRVVCPNATQGGGAGLLKPRTSGRSEVLSKGSLTSKVSSFARRLLPAYLNDRRLPKTGNPSRRRLEAGDLFLAPRRALRGSSKAEAAPRPRSPREHLSAKGDGGIVWGRSLLNLVIIFTGAGPMHLFPGKGVAHGTNGAPCYTTKITQRRWSGDRAGHIVNSPRRVKLPALDQLHALVYSCPASCFPIGYHCDKGCRSS